jgi:hypothetical protein
MVFGGLFMSPVQAEMGYFGGDKPVGPAVPSPQDAARGLKSMLMLGAEYAGQKLGRYDGFASNPAIRIHLPPDFQKAHDVLERFGLSARLDDLELKMNRAAEDAIPSLKPLIADAIRQLTFKEINKIVSGGDGAATTYFRQVSETELRASIQPVIEKSLRETGAQNTLKIINQSLNTLPMKPNLKFDMTAYVSEKTLDGVYDYMAIKEKDIRARPFSSSDKFIRQLFFRR